MRRCLPLLVLSSLAFAPAPFTRPERRTDAQKLQGKWERTLLHNGALIPEKPGEVVLEVTGDKAAFSRGGTVQTKWLIKLDASKNPKRLDIVRLDDSRGPVLHGIYRLEGDTLTWCYSGNAHPATFDRSAPGVILVVMKRIKR